MSVCETSIGPAHQPWCIYAVVLVPINSTVFHLPSNGRALMRSWCTLFWVTFKRQLAGLITQITARENNSLFTGMALGSPPFICGCHGAVEPNKRRGLHPSLFRLRGVTKRGMWTVATVWTCHCTYVLTQNEKGKVRIR